MMMSFRLRSVSEAGSALATGKLAWGLLMKNLKVGNVGYLMSLYKEN